MKLLLTSAGIKNASIHDALVDLLGKPVAEFQRLVHSHRVVRQSRGGCRGLAVYQRTGAQKPDV